MEISSLNNMSRQRDSNIELLRVVSIFLVLVVHANMLHMALAHLGLATYSHIWMDIS